MGASLKWWMVSLYACVEDASREQKVFEAVAEDMSERSRVVRSLVGGRQEGGVECRVSRPAVCGNLGPGLPGPPKSGDDKAYVAPLVGASICSNFDSSFKSPNANKLPPNSVKYFIVATVALKSWSYQAYVNPECPLVEPQAPRSLYQTRIVVASR